MPNVLCDCVSRRIAYEGLDGIIKLPYLSASKCTEENSISYSIECILGKLNTSKGKYLFFCTESELIGTFEDVKYFRIVRVKYLSIGEAANSDNEVLNVSNLIETLGFYYTFEEIEEHFLWNRVILKNFLDDMSESRFSSKLGDTDSNRFRNPEKQGFNVRSPFTMKISTNDEKQMDQSRIVMGKMFCGYFEMQTVRENGILYFLKIQSKISIKKIGTRMLSRGIDETGSVSFFVETKFTIKSDKERSEFTILRGSVPLYWSQYDPLKPHKIHLEKDLETNRKAFVRHFEKLSSRYGKIVVVDLLAGKKYERELSKLYRKLCLENEISYIHFDLNNYTKDFEDLKRILHEKIAESLASINSQDSAQKAAFNPYSTLKLQRRFQDFNISSNGYSENILNSEDSDDIAEPEKGSLFNKIKDDSDGSSDNMWEEPDSTSFTTPEYEKSMKLKNVDVHFRVNCMDCLDRTNICQYLLFSFTQPYNFKSIKTMWTNNGNALSNMYTGSNALKSELPSKGRISVFGMVNDFVISANRMINNKFTDKDKQNAIDLLLGKINN